MMSTHCRNRSCFAIAAFISAFLRGSKPQKELQTSGWPDTMIRLEDDGLAVATDSHTVDIFDQEAEMLCGMAHCHSR